jgi:hypothetical protein
MAIQIQINNNKVIVPIEWKRVFLPNVKISIEQFNQCLDFADKMAYWWNHQPLAFWWDKHHRSEWEIFKNALQGKLAEIGFYNFYTKKWKNIPYPDFWVWHRWVWEDTDVIINELKISIKSTKHFWNLLLLECDRYSNDWLYLESATWWDPIKHDLIYLIRVKWVDSNIPTDYKIENIAIEITWYITHDDFLDIIKNNQKIKQWSILGIPLIVDNYYICCSNLHKS